MAELEQRLDKLFSGLGQESRLLKLDTPLAADTVNPQRVHAIDRLSDGFDYTVDLLSLEHNLELKQLIAQEVTLWKGLSISTYGRPGAHGSQLDVRVARDQLKEAQELTKNLSEVSKKLMPGQDAFKEFIDATQAKYYGPGQENTRVVRKQADFFLDARNQTLAYGQVAVGAG